MALSVHIEKLSLFVFVLALASCSKHSKKNDTMLFYGECQVEVVTKTAGAEIFIDGIHVGEGEYKTQAPCGEKEITVLKEGFAPYRHYLPTSIAAPLKVTVELERLHHGDNYALSSKLVDQVRRGVKLKDPALVKLALAEGKAPEPEEFITDDLPSSVGGGGAAAPAAGGANYGTSPEDWR